MKRGKYYFKQMKLEIGETTRRLPPFCQSDTTTVFGR
jgi:hypothetical protein